VTDVVLQRLLLKFGRAMSELLPMKLAQLITQKRLIVASNLILVFNIQLCGVLFRVSSKSRNPLIKPMQNFYAEMSQPESEQNTKIWTTEFFELSRITMAEPFLSIWEVSPAAIAWMAEFVNF
jgi:hypothetical protein